MSVTRPRRSSVLPGPRPRRARLALERLEGRALMTNDFTSAVGIGGASVLAYAAAVDESGNSVVAGSFMGTVDFNPGAGTASLSPGGTQASFVAKYDSTGALVWARAFSQSAGTLGQAKALRLGQGGEVYVAGSFSGTADFDPGAGAASLTSAGGQDAYLVKLDAAGNYAWARRWGGAGTDTANGLAVSAAGNIGVAGSFQGTVDLDPGAGAYTRTSTGIDDIAALVFDAAGNLVWARSVGGRLSDVGHAAAFDATGALLVGGSFQSTVDFDPGAGVASLTSAGGQDAYVVRFDGAGAYAWVRRWGSSFADAVTALAGSGSGVVAVGSFQGTVDYDPGAGVANQTSAGLTDAYVVKLDGAGAYAWSASFGGTASDYGSAVTADASGDVYIAGSFQGTVDFAPGSGVVNLTTAGGYDGYAVKLDGGGGYQWAKRVGGISYDSTTAIALNASGTVALAGRYVGPASFGGLTLASAGTVNMYVARLGGGEASSSLTAASLSGPLASSALGWVAPEVAGRGAMDFGRSASSLQSRRAKPRKAYPPII